MNIFLLLIIFFLAQVLASCLAIVLGYFVPTITPTPGLACNVEVLCYSMLLVDLLIIFLLPKFRLVRKDDMSSLKERGTQGMLLTVVATVLMSLGISFLVEPFGLDDGGTDQLFEAMVSADLLASGLLLVFIGPLLEELIFREGLLRELLVRYKLSPMLSVLICSVTFGVVHGNVMQAIPSVLLGIMLGVMYIVSGDIRLSLLAHVVNNGLAFLLMLLPEWTPLSVFPTPVVIGMGALLCALGYLPIKKLIQLS